MDVPGTSLIIPCHNHADTVARAVDSGLRQSALQEILIVDDCSTDASARVCADLALRDSRIRVLTTEHNLGPGTARNYGVRAADASHVCFLDADDELLGDFFGDAHAIMSADPAVRLVKGDMEYFDPVKGYVLPSFDPRHKSATLSSCCGMVMERSLFLRLGGFPEDDIFRGPAGGEDVAFMNAVIEHLQPIGRIERPCYRVWSRGGSHLDKFLGNTRLKSDTFEFCGPEAARSVDGELERAIEAYRARVTTLLSANSPVR